jgi:hypothetical protein
VAPVAPPALRPTSLQFLDRSATVPYGTRTAARMRLVDSAGTGVGGASLRVCVRTGPDRTPRCEQRTTGADGTLRLPLTLRALTTVTAAFAGSAGHDGSLSPELTYRVAPKLLVERGRHALTVTVQPRSRTRVTLQWRSGGTWKEGTTLRTTRRGTVRFTDLAPGTYRVRTAAAAHLVRTTSKGWRLR